MDNTVQQIIETIAKTLSEHIHASPFDFEESNAASVLEFLYIAYAETREKDPTEVDRAFQELDEHLESLSLSENNEIFAIVCGLCCAYEKRAFIDAIQLGAYLILELTGK